MIDFHTHILPKIDDGSQSSEETARMLAEESAQGIDLIVATPHFYAHRMSMEDFLARRAASAERIRPLLETPQGGQPQAAARPRLMLGAEVYYFPGMGRADKLPSLCIEGTNVILVEMPFDQWTEDIYQEIRNIIYLQQLHVVLAHIERYPQFQKKQGVWDKVLQLPLTVQLNGGCFLSGMSRRRFALNMLRQREDAILGSDCHNMDTRKPNLQEAGKVIEKKLGSGRLRQIDEQAARLLEL